MKKGRKKIIMTTAEVIATETLKCGLLDLQLLDKTSYDFEDYYEKGFGLNQYRELYIKLFAIQVLKQKQKQ